MYLQLQLFSLHSHPFHVISKVQVNFVCGIDGVLRSSKHHICRLDYFTTLVCASAYVFVCKFKWYVCL
jgi:hypothetical protein